MSLNVRSCGVGSRGTAFVDSRETNALGDSIEQAVFASLYSVSTLTIACISRVGELS